MGASLACYAWPEGGARGRTGVEDARLGPGLTLWRVVISRSLLEPCSAAVTRESGSLDQVPDSGCGLAGPPFAHRLSLRCLQGRCRQNWELPCLWCSHVYTLAASSPKALLDMQVHTDRLSLCGERSAPQHRAYPDGASGPTASAEGFAAQPPTQAGPVQVRGLSCHCPSFSCSVRLVSQLMPGMAQSDT